MYFFYFNEINNKQYVKQTNKKIIHYDVKSKCMHINFYTI